VKVILAVLALALLASDVAQDLTFFADPDNRTVALVGSAVVRNLLLLAAAVALFLQSRAAAVLVFACAALGLVRRLSFLLPLQWDQGTIQTFHSGADLLFRLVLLGAVFDMVRRARSSS